MELNGSNEAERGIIAFPSFLLSPIGTGIMGLELGLRKAPFAAALKCGMGRRW